ncbi:hypothetical protein DYU05_03730 [Mucilaginibacter terrenus]|uniref:Uncharacterized protein n=1 Tax=Mucilaginibacter terrenus TaxID=2482727 RepID=A0A3E2NUP4_9SPHI|nr:hypothetical protein DYU05_03730 [Mucilaginibacter terrenus]
MIAKNYWGTFLLVSLVVVSLLTVLSEVVAGVDIVAVESVLVLSDPLPAAFSELHPAANPPIIAATSAKLKICFFIVV